MARDGARTQEKKSEPSSEKSFDLFLQSLRFIVKLFFLGVS